MSKETQTGSNKGHPGRKLAKGVLKGAFYLGIPLSVGGYAVNKSGVLEGQKSKIEAAHTQIDPIIDAAAGQLAEAAQEAAEAAQNPAGGPAAAAEIPTTTFEVATTAPGFDSTCITIDFRQDIEKLSEDTNTIEPQVSEETVTLTAEEAAELGVEEPQFTPDNLLYEAVLSTIDQARSDLANGIGNWHLVGAPERDKVEDFFIGTYSDKPLDPQEAQNVTWRSITGRARGRSVTDPETAILPDGFEFRAQDGTIYAVGFEVDASAPGASFIATVYKNGDKACASGQYLPSTVTPQEALVAYETTFGIK